MFFLSGVRIAFCNYMVEIAIFNFMRISKLWAWLVRLFWGGGKLYVCDLFLVLVTASLWSPSIYTHQQDFTQDHLVLRKQSYTRTLSPGSGPAA